MYFTMANTRQDYSTDGKSAPTFTYLSSQSRINFLATCVKYFTFGNATYIYQLQGKPQPENGLMLMSETETPLKMRMVTSSITVFPVKTLLTFAIYYCTL